MRRVLPMSWLNQLLLLLSVSCALLTLIIQQWAILTPFQVYAFISWVIFVIVLSVWLSCVLFQFALKASCPLNLRFLNKWLYEKLIANLSLHESERRKKRKRRKEKRRAEINNLAKELRYKYVDSWYSSISNDKFFPHEAEELLRKLLCKLFSRISLIDEAKLVHRICDVFLLHLKEYHKASRRVEKGAAASVEEAFKCLHPGSRNVPALEHMLHRMVTILAQEFLQWELTSSLPCRLLLSILARRLLILVETISSPNWLFHNLSHLLQPNALAAARSEKEFISNALGDGITSATAAVVPISKPKLKDEEKSASVSDEKPILCLKSLATEHRGLWGESMTEMDSEAEEGKVSPIYEEPTDFATTIARLRTVLQQKSTVNTPLHAEEKSYVVYEDSQFTNLSIPWTEFHTALDGSQQLLYCIQFDDVEQRGVDLFETTTATVRRQYRDFVQLHSSLQELPELASVMQSLVLPEGGRVELENYLKTLTTRLANECPSQLRHFLRPSSNANKKADAIAPRFDKFLVKTVSGVFNTLKTVVPGFEIEQEEENVPLPTLMSLADIPWRFVEDVKSKSLAANLQQLVEERVEYSCVDTAYEAVDSMESNDAALMAHWWETVKSSDEEDVEELDSRLSLTSVGVDLICELLAGIGSNNNLQQEAVIRWTKLLFGNVTEPILNIAAWQIFEQLSNESLFQNVQKKFPEEPLSQLKERLLSELLLKVPSDLKLIFGEEDTLSVLRYLMDSYSVKRINVDLNLQILDVLASQLLISCRSGQNSTV